MLEEFFRLIGVLAVATIPMMQQSAWTLAASVFVLAETASIWLLVAFYGAVIKEIRKRRSN
jgi:hypothetical protein